MDTTTIVAIVIPIITAVCTLVSFFIGRQAAAKQKGELDGEKHADIQYIKRRVDDILLEQKDTNKTLESHGERITRLEESAKQAHHRIDEINSKLGIVKKS
jgi:peptidoglycan hydrolase CwlO-like protein